VDRSKVEKELEVAVAIANGRGERLEKAYDAMSPQYQLAKAKSQGYDLAKCLETVMKGDSLSQCTRASGYGLEKLYCKQHGVKHPEAKKKNLLG
jgi:hypothetical protein